MVTSFSGGRSRSIRREPLTTGKHLVTFITYGSESRALVFFNLQSLARTHAVLVIGLYELLGNPTTQLIENSGPYSNWSLELMFVINGVFHNFMKYSINYKHKTSLKITKG